VNRYTADDGKKLFRKSFCAYFDILGFSNKIQKEDLKFFERYLRVLNQEIKFLDEQYDYYDKDGYKRFELKIFTDNFVLGYPWQDRFGESELGYLNAILSHIQFNFIKSGIFIKGAISLSKLFMDENIVLGKALIEAYQLEEAKSVYPRIILSDKAKDVVHEHIGYYADHKTSPQNQQYLKDTDGFYFVNYLYELIDESQDRKGYEDFKYISSELILHKKAVEKGLIENKNNHRVFEKYSWTANYHNYFCHNFLSKENYQIRKILIKKKLYETNIDRCIN
jgi:hypothetical protein